MDTARAAAAMAVFVVFAGVTTGGVAVAAADPSAKIVARYPADDGNITEMTVIAPADVMSVSTPDNRSGRWLVPITLTDSGARSFAEAMNQTGFTSDRGISNCPTNEPKRNNQGYCLLTVVDGEVVFSAAMGPELADHLRSGGFVQNPQFVLVASDEEPANRLAQAFRESTTTGEHSKTQTRTDPTSHDSRTSTETSAPGFGVSAALLAALSTFGIARVRE